MSQKRFLVSNKKFRTVNELLAGDDEITIPQLHKCIHGSRHCDHRLVHFSDSCFFREYLGGCPRCQYEAPSFTYNEYKNVKLMGFKRSSISRLMVGGVIDFNIFFVRDGFRI